MQTFKFNRYETNLFDTQHANLVYDQEMYLPFINRVMSKENINGQTTQKKFSAEDRLILKQELLSQYSGIKLNDKVQRNIDALEKSNTFTITTGHQLSLFTGPLYFVIKILHVIKQCEELNLEFPDKNFIPVYWMASEDHDFEEVQQTSLFNREIKWDSTQKGPVGKFILDSGFEEVKASFASLFSEDDQEIMELINSYKGDNYGAAFRNFVHTLFSKYGLVILDGDSSVFKSRFESIMRKELTTQFSHKCVDKTSQSLKSQGGKLQISAREINLFYIQEGIRERIVFDNGNYIIDGVGSFSEAEILNVLTKNPEKFSPNVVLRPVYQETILPNVMYVGGGGEISYWLQLKDVFSHVDVLYPLIQVRNSILWVDGAISGKISKFDLLLEDVFKQEDLLKREYVELHESDSLDFAEFDTVKTKFLVELKELIVQADAGLLQYSESETTKINKQIDQIQSKLIRASKSKHESAMKAIEQIKSKLFPGNGLQERKINFFNFCQKGDVSNKLNLLYSAIEPFEKDLIVIRDIPEVK